ncbi:hypothetical protein ABEG17_04160 [Pedococcus sp. KACC 23699]|uniref:Uncharacterized protein n=1 Tax=Pedococcus sp. KACC 23699 TaxID=3149228 RepID=A0AAU7JW83_9MICO
MSRPTPVPALSLVALTAALLTGGCGSPADSATSSTASSSTTGTSSFPITIERSGGIAGFADKVVVAKDGSATVTTKSGTGTCTVTPGILTALARTAAAGVTRSTTAASPGADAMVVTLTTPDGTFGLVEGDLPGTAPEVGALLEDLAKPKAQRTTCR